MIDIQIVDQEVEVSVQVKVRIPVGQHAEHLAAGAEREEIARRVISEAVKELQEKGVESWKTKETMQAERDAYAREAAAKLAEMDAKIQE